MSRSLLGPATSRRDRALRLALAGMVVAVSAFAGLIVTDRSTPTNAAAVESSAVTKDAFVGEWAEQYPDAKVTVSQTKNLVAQTVTVSWTGMPPSGQSGQSYPTEQGSGLIRVVQCWGADPAISNQCYSLENGGNGGFRTRDGKTEPHLHEGVTNQVLGAISPDGTGSVTFEIRTLLESGALGCTDTDACSLIVLPRYGGTDWNATNGPEREQIWENRIVFPLEFAPIPSRACGANEPDMTMAGSSLVRRLMTSWTPQFCLGEDRLIPDYTELSEPEGRLTFTDGTRDVGLTVQPYSDSEKPERPFAYAPITTTGLSIVVIYDDTALRRQVTGIKLNARLVAKLLTQSYDSYAYYCEEFDPGPRYGAGVPTSNPENMFYDPEFQQLNPGHTNGSLGGSDVPQWFTENSDIAWTLTNWVAHDPDAVAFLKGAKDPWGMVVNPAYKNIQDQWPSNALELRDEHRDWQAFYQPTRLLTLGRNLAASVAPALTLAADPPTREPNGCPIRVQKRGPQLPGTRGMIGFVDTATAEAYKLESALIQNASGQFVAPTREGMLAAVAGMKTNPDGITQQVDLDNSDPAAYPLTMVQYAIVPTAEPNNNKADAIADVLEYAAGPGQEYGPLMGESPQGYLRLTNTQRQQTLDAAKAVREQAGRTPSPSRTSDADNNNDDDDNGQTGNETPGPAPAATDTNGSTAPSGTNTSISETPSSAPASGTGPSGSTSISPIVTNPSPTPVAATGKTGLLGMGTARWILLILLIAGGTTAVAATVFALWSKPDNRFVKKLRRLVIGSR